MTESLLPTTSPLLPSLTLFSQSWVEAHSLGSFLTHHLHLSKPNGQHFLPRTVSRSTVSCTGPLLSFGDALTAALVQRE